MRWMRFGTKRKKRNGDGEGKYFKRQAGVGPKAYRIGEQVYIALQYGPASLPDFLSFTKKSQFYRKHSETSGESSYL